jgi:hypothetical protein
MHFTSVERFTAFVPLVQIQLFKAMSFSPTAGDLLVEQ